MTQCNGLSFRVDKGLHNTTLSLKILPLSARRWRKQVHPKPWQISVVAHGRSITEDSNLHSQHRDILQSRGLLWRLVINSMVSSSSGETYSRLAYIRRNFGPLMEFCLQ